VRIILLFIIFSSSFQVVTGQEEIINVLAKVRSAGEAEQGQAHCTAEFWTAEVDNGEKTFKRLVRLNERATLEVSNTQKGKGRVVYTVDIMADGIKRDELYACMVEKNGKWLLDGFHEEKETIPYFLDGSISGHFSPLELPSNKELDKLGAEILAFGKNEDAVIDYCLNHFAKGSKLRFINQLTSEDYSEVRLVSTGYSDVFDRGFIYFEQTEAESDWKSRITIYVTLEENGDYRIYLNYFTKPWVSGFFGEE